MKKWFDRNHKTSLKEFGGQGLREITKAISNRQGGRERKRESVITGVSHPEYI